MKRSIIDEKNIHRVFEISLILKGIFAGIESIAGIAAYFVSQQFLLTLVTVVTADEMADDPRNFISNYLLHTAQSFSVGAQHFTAFYLFSHGAVKLFVIIGLLRQKLWYYPMAIIVFVSFIAYQLYRYTFTHSGLLLLLTVVDLVVIWLTWHEYKYLRTHKLAA
jgi:uncharacterized membrane protein